MTDIVHFSFARLYPVDSNRLDDGRGILEATSESDAAIGETANNTDSKPQTDTKTEKKTN